MIQESGEKTTGDVDLFDALVLPKVAHLVSVLGPVSFEDDFMAANMQQAAIWSAAMERRGSESLIEQATEMGADVLFLHRPNRKVGLVTESLRLDGTAAQYNQGVTAQHINERLV